MTYLAAAGIAAPLWFTVLVIVQGVLQPDYSHLALPISALAAWPAGWLQNVNFGVFGLLMMAYAIGLDRGVRPGHGGRTGLALLLISGLGVVVAGIFPWTRTGGEFIVPAGHFVGAFMTFLGAGLGLVVMSRRMAADPQWRRLAGYVLVSGLGILGFFVAMGPLAVPADAPLHQWAGLLQRVTVAVWFACTLVLAVTLLRQAKAATKAIGATVPRVS